MASEEEAQESWCRDVVPRAMEVVSVHARLPQRDLCALLLASPWCARVLLANPTIWEIIDLHEMKRAGERLISALPLPRYRHIKMINLEFAQDIEDRHFLLLKDKGINSLNGLESLNLNACQKLSDKGVEAITSICPNLRAFSIYWNVKITHMSIQHIAKNCKEIVDLNVSGCKNITDESLLLIANSYPKLERLDITRCVKLTDDGLQHILCNCSSLQSLNLYALSSFTPIAYRNIAILANLVLLDLCGAQNLTDDCLTCIARCQNLTSLNLTWCVRITDIGVVVIAQGCQSLQLLSLFGVVGVTDKSLAALSESCSSTLTTLDVNGCIGIKKRSRDDLLGLFPHLTCFKVHS